MSLTNIVVVMNNAIWLNQKCIVISHIRRIYPVGIYNDPYIRRYISIIVYKKRIVCRSSVRRLCARRNRSRRRYRCSRRQYRKGKLAKRCGSRSCPAILTTIFIWIWRTNHTKCP